MKVNDLFESQDAVVALIRKVCPKNFQLLISGCAVPMYRGTEQHAGYQTAETPMYHATVVPSRSKARGFPYVRNESTQQFHGRR